jgi:hypothetical protein
MEMPSNHQELSEMAQAYCDQKGYQHGPTRKVAYQAFVAALAQFIKVEDKKAALPKRLKLHG